FGEDAVVCGGAAGIHVLVHMRAIDPDAAPALVARAAAQGLGIYLATPYYVDPPRRTELLFGYACLEEKQIRAGIRLLATIMR
ncbi:MAG TPA: hypothetical protein VK427_07220, partial [Kofleriaceae bacterium]|nr:hypothetical protein [Kofleriaceae bacterium]